MGIHLRTLAGVVALKQLKEQLSGSKTQLFPSFKISVIIYMLSRPFSSNQTCKVFFKTEIRRKQIDH